MPDLATLAPWIAAAFFLAGLVKGVVGMGLPTVVMGVMGLVTAPVYAAALLIVPSLATNLWQMFAGPALLAVARRLALMLIGSSIGIFWGIGLLTGADTRLPSIVLGGVLAAYGLIALFMPKLAMPRKAEPWASPVVGVATGVLAGGTGVFVVPAVPYMSALAFTKDELVQALGLSFTVSSLALGLALHGKDSYPASLALASLAGIIPAAIGMWLGQKVRGRLNPELFRRWFFVAMIVVGAVMILRVW